MKSVGVFVNKNSFIEIPNNQDGYIIINKQIYEAGYEGSDVAAITIIITLCAFMVSFLIVALHKTNKIKLPFLP
jgi:hypothetical protein